MNDTSPTERLSKRLARTLGCSRRDAERYIAGGWVRLDGQVVEEPQFKISTQTLELAKGARVEEIPPATLLVHVGPDEFSAPDTASSEQAHAASLARQWLTHDTHWADDPDRRTPLKAHFRGQQALLSLSPGEQGLWVFSQDRRVIRRLAEDTSRLEQEWLVEVTGTLDAAQLESLCRGTALPGKQFAPGKVSWQSETRLRVAVKGMVPGQVQAMCAALGLGVVTIKRLRIGGVSLARVPAGQWRYLRVDERF
ncbi:RNA pseudouridine synthase [Halomonas urumqiensis]|uniref:Dual-specificity RNA pseudouridine synthase RluF n=1 Tax=Halomonas urumqiensis TaxID=1684789 RepID=A0A2N7UFR9_9GAMM|nr:RNA pseudouridine synthase [Halomonas urumqiensis]PMR79297.1 RNA-binding protein [Halomonas urumqiensis]PTB03971.1 RNA-binding protein [Halomonas urumqiensis]GHE19774.1 hypothetical protein GCM10017767_02950 [Halomonas urumqiensis]